MTYNRVDPSFSCGLHDLHNCVSCERNVRFTDYGHDNSASGFSNDDIFPRIIQGAANESNYYDYDDNQGSDTFSATSKGFDSVRESNIDLYTCVECEPGYTLSPDPFDNLVYKCITKKKECEFKSDHDWVEAKKTCYNKASCSETQGYIWNDENKTCITKKEECKDREDHYWVNAKKTCHNKDSCSDTQGLIWNDENKTCITQKEECELKSNHDWVEAKKTCHNKTSCSDTQGYIWNDEDKTCITIIRSCNKKEGYIWNDVDKKCITKKDSCNKKEGHVWKNNQCITKKKECEGREDHYWVEAAETCHDKDSCSETQGYVWNDVDKTCITKETNCKSQFGYDWNSENDRCEKAQCSDLNCNDCKRESMSDVKDKVETMLESIQCRYKPSNAGEWCWYRNDDENTFNCTSEPKYKDKGKCTYGWFNNWGVDYCCPRVDPTSEKVPKRVLDTVNHCKRSEYQNTNREMCNRKKNLCHSMSGDWDDSDETVGKCTLNKEKYNEFYSHLEQDASFFSTCKVCKGQFEPKKFDNLTAEQMKEYLVLNSSKSKDDYNNTMVKDLKKEMLFLSMLDGSICVPKNNNTKSDQSSKKSGNDGADQSPKKSGNDGTDQSSKKSGNGESENTPMKCRILTPSIQCSQCSVNTEGGMLKCDACDPGFQLRGNICFKDESPKGVCEYRGAVWDEKSETCNDSETCDTINDGSSQCKRCTKGGVCTECHDGQQLLLGRCYTKNQKDQLNKSCCMKGEVKIEDGLVPYKATVVDGMTRVTLGEKPECKDKAGTERTCVKKPTSVVKEYDEKRRDACKEELYEWDDENKSCKNPCFTKITEYLHEKDENGNTKGMEGGSHCNRDESIEKENSCALCKYGFTTDGSKDVCCSKFDTECSINKSYIQDKFEKGNEDRFKSCRNKIFTPKWWDYKPEQCYKNSEDKWVCGPRDAPECRNLYRQFLGFTDDEDGEPKNINTDEKLCKRIGGIWGGKIEGKSSIMFPVDYMECEPVCVDKEGTWNSETRTYTCGHTESTCNQDKITGSGGIYLRNILNSCSKWSCSFANKNEDLNDDSASDSNKTGRLCDTRRNLQGDAPTFSDTSDDSCCLCAFGYKVIGTGTGAGVSTTKMLEEYENSLGNEFDDDIDELMNVDYEDLTLAQQAEWNKKFEKFAVHASAKLAQEGMQFALAYDKDYSFRINPKKYKQIKASINKAKYGKRSTKSAALLVLLIEFGIATAHNLNPNDSHQCCVLGEDNCTFVGCHLGGDNNHENSRWLDSKSRLYMPPGCSIASTYLNEEGEPNSLFDFYRDSETIKDREVCVALGFAWKAKNRCGCGPGCKEVTDSRTGEKTYFYECSEGTCVESESDIPSRADSCNYDENSY